MNLNLDVSQKLMFSQHMMQSMEILQMSVLELETYIENLAVENPLVDLPEYDSVEENLDKEYLQRKMDWLESTDLQNKVYYQQDRSSVSAEQNWHDQSEQEETLSEYLWSQIMLTEYDDLERSIIRFLILSLDDKGYLNEDICVAAEYFSVSEESAQHLLEDIQSLDPAGVGARNLKECMLLQLKRKPMVSEITVQIVEHHLEDVAKNHLARIAKKLGVEMDAITAACDEIRSLNPKPGMAFSNRMQLRYISPDVVVVKLKDTFEILLNEYQYPRFTINQYYENMLANTTDAEVKSYLQDKMNQAQWVQNCIQQRSSTISKVMHVLVEKQKDFFVYGVGHKHPMKLADIAEEVEVHESTVSRTLRGKYLQCAWGVFPLNYFLTSVAVRESASGEEVTPEQVKRVLQQIVDSENKERPLSDQKICEKMEEYHIKIARRTVNKYRVELGIPDKQGRKEACIL